VTVVISRKITNFHYCNDNETNPNYNLQLKPINNPLRYPSSVLSKDGFDASDGFRGPKGREGVTVVISRKIANFHYCNDDETNPSNHLLRKPNNNPLRDPSSVLSKVGFDASAGFWGPKGREGVTVVISRKIVNFRYCNDNETNPNYNLQLKPINNPPKYPSSVLGKDGFDASGGLRGPKEREGVTVVISRKTVNFSYCNDNETNPPNNNQQLVRDVRGASQLHLHHR
jgi:hypothetical protein